MSFYLGVHQPNFIFFPKEEQVRELWAVFWTVVQILLFFFRIEDEELYLDFDPDWDWEAFNDSIDAFTTDNRTPFRRACENGDSEIVTTLLKNGEHGGKHDLLFCPEHIGQGTMLDRTMIWACRNGDVEVVNILLNKGAFLGEGIDHYPPLHYACMHGHADVAKVLLENGADVKYGVKYWRNGVFKTNTPLLLACKYGHADVVNVLLDNGADINENILMRSDHYIGKKFCRFNTPLYTAWMGAHSSVIKLLLDRKANTDVLW